jgi:hypothetical protein
VNALLVAADVGPAVGLDYPGRRDDVHFFSASPACCLVMPNGTVASGATRSMAAGYERTRTPSRS